MALGPNGTGQQGQQGSNSNTGAPSRGLIAKTVGDISQWFKPAAELTPIPGQRQQQNRQNTQNQQNQDRRGEQGDRFSKFGDDNEDTDQDNQNQQRGRQQQEQNPLDVYSGLFSTQPKLDKDGKPIAPPTPPEFKLDPKTITDAAGKIDFMSGLSEETTQKLQSGNIDATTLQEVVQHAGRNAYAQAMQHMSTLTDRFTSMRLGYEQQGLPQAVHRILAKHQSINNPAIRNNPVLKEHFEMVSERLAAKFPDQPPDWIAEQTNAYFTDIAKAVNPSFGEAPKQERTPDGVAIQDGKVFDWQGYLSQPKG